MPNTKKTLKQLLAEQLAAIKTDVTRRMKYAVALELDTTDRTIERYLDGEIANLESGTAILNALKKEIQKAAEAIHQ